MFEPGRGGSAITCKDELIRAGRCAPAAALINSPYPKPKMQPGSSTSLLVQSTSNCWSFKLVEEWRCSEAWCTSSRGISRKNATDNGAQGTLQPALHPSGVGVQVGEHPACQAVRVPLQRRLRRHRHGLCGAKGGPGGQAPAWRHAARRDVAAGQHSRGHAPCQQGRVSARRGQHGGRHGGFIRVVVCELCFARGGWGEGAMEERAGVQRAARLRRVGGMVDAQHPAWGASPRPGQPANTSLGPPHTLAGVACAAGLKACLGGGARHRRQAAPFKRAAHLDQQRVGHSVACADELARLLRGGTKVLPAVPHLPQGTPRGARELIRRHSSFQTLPQVRQTARGCSLGPPRICHIRTGATAGQVQRVAVTVPSGTRRSCAHAMAQRWAGHPHRPLPDSRAAALGLFAIKEGA